MQIDNIVYRMNLGNTLRQARQLVVHGHILINGKKVDKPSYQVSVGDIISLKEKSRQNEVFKNNMQNSVENPLQYISVDDKTYSGTLKRSPNREEIPIQIEDHLVVEYYSTIL
jgi:small subunit ribosomal protein S4